MSSSLTARCFSITFLWWTRPPDRIPQVMTRMLTMAAKPVLKELQLGIADLPNGVEIYPYPVPDLFAGAPVIISGKFHGRFPQSVRLEGWRSP